MAARSIRFRKKRPVRWPWFVVVALILGALGWSGWRLVTDRPLWPFGAETEVAESEAGAAPGGGPADRTQAAAPETPAPAQPVGETSVRAVLESVMTTWVDALVNDDFTMFHETLSSAWRRQDDPARLLAAYGVLAPHKENLSLFPSRGKLVLLESRPFQEVAASGTEGAAPIRDTLGPETPWLVRGEWRVNKMALGFTLTLGLEEGQWRPLGLNVDIYT